MNSTVSFDDLDQDPSQPTQAQRDAAMRQQAHVVNGGESMHDCPKCRGSGWWTSPSGWTRKPCFKCKGSGRVTRGVVAAAKAKVTRERNWAEWCEENAVLIEGLRRHSWNSFLSGLHSQIFEGQRMLSERQVEAGFAAIARYDLKREEKRAAETASRSTDIGLSAVEKLFAAATASGLKRPMFRAERVAIKQSRTPGVLYVYDREDGGERGGYAGKITGGVFVRSRDAAADVGEALRAVAADPLAAAVAYGRSTGTCCMCGRELTDPESVRLGIGPVCAGNWGF